MKKDDVDDDDDDGKDGKRRRTLQILFVHNVNKTDGTGNIRMLQE